MQSHVRNTFLAGIFAVVPVGVTIFIIWKVETTTRFLTEYVFGRSIPVVGILIALLLIYAAGMAVTSLFGKWFFSLFDRALGHIPGLNVLYQTWKQIALTPGGTEGTFSHVVLVPSEVGGMQIGFTSTRTITGHEQTWCVFVPGAPNPLTGRMHFVHKDRCLPLDCSAEEAFKVLISTGNYVPAEVGNAIAARV